MQCSDSFQAWINRIAHLSFLLGLRGKIAIGRIADQTILQAESEDCFREARRKGDYSTNGDRDMDRAAEFVDNLARR